MRPPQREVRRDARRALAEDIGSGDITASLVDAGRAARALVTTREAGVVCGRPWVDEVFRQLDASVRLDWHVGEGQRVAAGERLFSLAGPARSLLSGERAALNFYQLLSGTATRCDRYARLVAGTGARLLDTRKTIPGLRLAQKYAVRCGGCHNHRDGLFDAFLIKENHILACGSLAAAVARARASQPSKPLVVEVESLAELEQALAAGCDRVLLDNFNLADLRAAVRLAGGAVELEASGGITAETLRPVAETGVDCISVGGLTKHLESLDLSMRLT